MATPIAPSFRTPMTDLVGGLTTHQTGTRCADFEMRAMQCLEAYGVQKGRVRCVDYLDDLRECAFQAKQVGFSASPHSTPRTSQVRSGKPSSKPHCDHSWAIMAKQDSLVLNFRIFNSGSRFLCLLILSWAPKKTHHIKCLILKPIWFSAISRKLITGDDY